MRQLCDHQDMKHLGVWRALKKLELVSGMNQLLIVSSDKERLYWSVEVNLLESDGGSIGF